MRSFTEYDAVNYTLDVCSNLKDNQKIFVVFSTFGEREAELIYDKITLLKNELGDYIDKFFLSHRRAGDTEELTEKKAREADPDIELLICNTCKVPDMGSEKGKGSDMRRMLYHINTGFMGGDSPEDVVLVFLDADVVTEYFGSHFVTALSGAILDGNDFAKASFWRKMGRVKKFVAQPLFSVVDHPKLKHLADFHYPLSGEVAGTVDFFNLVHFWQIYGVETGINIDSSLGEYRVADVNLGLYDHEHQTDVNIQKMAFGIIRTYLKQLHDYGIISFNDGASLSDIFRAAYIDDKGSRQKIEYDLSEKKYRPLVEVLQGT